jgi:malate dehydrogenase (oxaloacetate-decarboxylating)
LPVVLDCGTDNEGLLNDDLYLGLKERRVRGEKYDQFVEAFVTAARKLFPRAYIHFEDFGLANGESVLSERKSPGLTCHIQHGGFWTTIDPRSLASMTIYREQAVSRSQQ